MHDGCRELLACVLARAVADSDRRWALEPEFDLYCRLVGLSESAAFLFKLRFMLGLLDRRRFDACTFHALRWDRKDERPGVHWASWGTSPLPR